MCVVDVALQTEAIIKRIVHRQLITLNPSKSEGADKMLPKILASLACYLAVPLAKLFNDSLETGIIPIINNLPTVQER